MIWELTYRIFVDKLHIWKANVYTSPFNVIKTFISLNENNYVIKNVFFSMQRLITGFFIALILGLILGILISKYEFLKTNVRSLILALQTLPNVAWVPIAVLWFGLSDASILFTIIIGSVFAMILATEGGISSINPLYLKAAQTMGASGRNLYFKVLLPASLPIIVNGMKQAWSFAWRALMAGEMLAGKNGLGYILMTGKKNENLSQIVLVLLIIVILGVVFENLIFGKIERNLRKKWGLNKS